MPSYYLTKTGKTNNNSYNVDKLSRKFENKSMIPENSFYSAKVKTQYFVVERKRTENHEKFNKEINKANNVLENLLETCNKMLSNSQFLQNTSSAQESKREEKKEKSIFIINLNKNTEYQIVLAKETDYEEDFEYYSAEFNGNILVIKTK